MVIVLEPIFEADLLPNQYGFRPKLDAKMAVRRAYWHVRGSGRTEVVDADLRDYFGSIPHGPLMRCVARRVADGTVLSVIKSWLEMPVVERTPRGDRRSASETDTGGRRRARPVALLSNLYFRRFLLAWEQHGHRQRLDAHVVNYADDLVICRPPQRRHGAAASMRQLMARLGLTVNEANASGAAARGQLRLPRLRDRSLHGQGGTPFIGTRPSRKAVKRRSGRSTTRRRRGGTRTSRRTGSGG